MQVYYDESKKIRSELKLLNGFCDESTKRLEQLIACYDIVIKDLNTTDPSSFELSLLMIRSVDKKMMIVKSRAMSIMIRRSIFSKIRQILLRSLDRHIQLLS